MRSGTPKITENNIIYMKFHDKKDKEIKNWDNKKVVDKKYEN